MSNRSIYLDDQIYDYLLRHSLRETDIQRRLREETMQHEWARMQVAPEQGQFMALLVELLAVKCAIEIGTFTGYSALCMTMAMPADGRLICCDLNAEWTAIGEAYWQEAGIRDRIDLRIAPALETLEELLMQGVANTFDLAFIDADKENYLNYYEACLALVRPGGLILFDNTLWGGSVADPEIEDAETQTIRELNDQLHTDDRISLSLLPLGDGLTLARKRN